MSSANEANYFYVCDRCGDVITIEAAPILEGVLWECEKCGGSAVWEFASSRHALEHAAHISAMYRDGVHRELR